MKKKIIILMTVAFIVILGIIGLIIIPKGNDKKSKVEIKDWKDRYFYYLKDLEELNPIKVGNVGFLDSKISDEPIMYVEQKRTDEKENNISFNYYYIKDDMVAFLGGYIFDEYPKVAFLYNNDKNEYAYYVIEKVNGKQSYSMLEKRLQSYAEYNNKDNFGQTFYEVNEDGTIKLDNNTKKYKDEIFIDPKVEENFFKFINDKNEFRKKLDNYKKQNEFITDEVRKIVEDGIKNTEENPKRIQEEQSITKHDTTNTTSIKLGDYTLKYGKYRACFDASTCREFILNQDGTATFDGKPKYFRVDNYNFAQGVIEKQMGQNIYPSIIISDTKNGNTEMNVYTPYLSTPECLMSDGELECVKYIGE